MGIASNPLFRVWRPTTQVRSSRNLGLLLIDEQRRDGILTQTEIVPDERDGLREVPVHSSSESSLETLNSLNIPRPEEPLPGCGGRPGAALGVRVD